MTIPEESIPPGELERSTQRVLAPLSQDQQRLVDLVADNYFSLGGRWPTLQFVEAVFDADRLDVRSVLGSLPTVGGSGIRYGAAAAIAWAGNLHEKDTVALTLLGLYHCKGVVKREAETLIGDVVKVLSQFVQMRRSFRPSPTELTVSEMTSEQVLEALSVHRAVPPSLGQLYRIMEHEPAFMTGGRGATDAGASSWRWEVRRTVLAYEGVNDVEQYVRRIAAEYALPVVSAARVLSSPRNLPAALDYLDTVWRLVHGRDVHLVRLPGAERTMLLGFGVTGREEFLERTGTLGDLLKGLAIPKGGDQRGGHPLGRLRAYLRSRLPPESHERVERAIAMLDRVRIVRNAGSHAEAELEAVAAYRAMGVDFPVTDWARAWDAVRDHCVEALDTLREELAVLAETDESAGTADGEA